MPKGISYDTIQNMSMFHPGRFTSGLYIVTHKLPPSYTIMPFSNWGTFTLAALPAGSLVCICAAGTYKGVLGYVFGTSNNLANECALVAVVPKIKYPNICYPMEDQCHIIPPARKCTKIKSSLNHPHLFDPNRLLV